jgi:hypothetical protein
LVFDSVQLPFAKANSNELENESHRIPAIFQKVLSSEPAGVSNLYLVVMSLKRPQSEMLMKSFQTI